MIFFVFLPRLHAVFDSSGSNTGMARTKKTFKKAGVRTGRRVWH